VKKPIEYLGKSGITGAGPVIGIEHLAFGADAYASIGRGSTLMCAPDTGT